MLTVEHLLERIQPGLLGPQVRPLRERIRKILESGDVRGFSYVNSPRFWAYDFRGAEGDIVEAEAAGILVVAENSAPGVRELVNAAIASRLTLLAGQ